MDYMILYDKYLQVQASKLDLETVGEKAYDISDGLQELSSVDRTTEKWCDTVEYAIGETVEYINLCLHLCGRFGGGRSLIIPDVVNIAVALCELKHRVAKMDGPADRREALLERLEDAIHGAGGTIMVQDEKYWLCISRLFDLDPDGTMKESLESGAVSVANVEDAEEDEDEPTPKKEMTMAEMALRVLRVAMDLPDGLLSLSWVQRRFSCGYGRAAQLVDWLADRGYVQSHADMVAEGLRGRRIYASKEMLEDQ